MEPKEDGGSFEPTPTFNSLRSRFEHLSSSKQPNPAKKPIVLNDSALLSPGGPSSPRQRAVSNTEADTKAAQDAQPLRSSASSSDLRKRPPPPPPPPRNASPVMPASPADSVSNLAVDVPHQHQGFVSSLRNKFSGSPGHTPIHTPTHTPRPSRDLLDYLFKDGVRSDNQPSESNYSDPPSTQTQYHSSEPSASDSELRLSLPPRPTRKPPIPINSKPIYRPDSSDGTETGPHSSSSSLISFDSQTSVELDYQLARPPPPPPPQRTNKVRSDNQTASKSTSSLVGSTTTLPPPLPVRRTPTTSEDPTPPRLPLRPIIPSESASSATLPAERALNRLPPPPTRTIALGEKLPPPRRASTPMSSDDDDDGEEEEDPRLKAIEKLPDGSCASRLPPNLSNLEYSTRGIHVPAHTGRLAVSGSTVIVSRSHHIFGYDLSVGELPIWSLDKRDMKLKDNKITSIEFRPAQFEHERGIFLWVGTKEGHIIEVDTCTGAIKQFKSSAHSHTITHIFRYARSMITIDTTSGKCNIFTPTADEDVSLMHTQPLVKRIPEKQDWICMLGGLLWTATRPDVATAIGGTHRSPNIRTYDHFSPGGSGKPLVIPAGEQVGAVISGTIMSTQPNKVYLGHEGGSISVWALEGPSGIPICVEVMKVSSSDVLCLAGLHNRLWAGGRKGEISAYDVEPRPWVVTNAWQAHSGTPVVSLAVDPFSIDKIGQLSVASIGRDETVNLWDGLFGRDWTDTEIRKRDASFSRLRDLNVLIVSWNLDAALPDSLTGNSVNLSFLDDVLTSVGSPDIITFGFQEIIDLEDKGLTAKNVLYGGMKRTETVEDTRTLEKISGAYSRWTDRLVNAVRNSMDPNCPYERATTEVMVGLYSCTFVKNSERISLKDKATAYVKRGMGGRYGNKGAILHRFVVDDSSICFINCHLAAGQHHIRERNADVTAIFEATPFSNAAAVNSASAFVGGGDGTMVMDHEIVFAYGDMNYRIEGRRENIIAHAESGELDSILMRDQLIKQLRYTHSFRFRQFHEGPIHFAPTYKYDRRSNTYDSSEKARRPAWCDRILWRSRDESRVKQLHYRRWEANVSDHRPISSAFKITVKAVRQDAWRTVQLEVEALWAKELAELLSAASDHYVNLALI